MPITLDGTNGITTPTYGGADTSEYLVPVTQFKNRIINGAMVISQRNGTTAVNNSNNTYTLDRWVMQTGLDNKFTVAQSSTAPTGFSNSLLVTSSSAYSVPSGEYYTIVQKIEGFNTSDLAFGTASAKTVTLSFQVYSSLTGTFGGALANSANNRSYPFTYTISSANTWTSISVTIAGDTTGTWIGGTNGIGLNVIFGLGVGSTYSGTAGAWAGADYRSATGATSVVGTNGATFYLTGVQLEIGSTATSFDYRPYGTELSLCERYYQKYSGNINGNPDDGGVYTIALFSSTSAYWGFAFPQMRTGPSFSYSSLNDFNIISAGTNRTPLTSFASNGCNTNRIELYAAWTTGLTAGDSAWLRITSSSGWYALSAEL